MGRSYLTEVKEVSPKKEGGIQGEGVKRARIKGGGAIGADSDVKTSRIKEC